MKTILCLFLLAAPALADCVPWEVQLGNETLKGCGDDWQLYKARNLRITFPDKHTEDRQPDGHGSCGQSTSCDALTGLIYVLQGLTECWPRFETPVQREGLWQQTVYNQLAVQNLRQCSGSLFTAGPVQCVDHPTVRPNIQTVTWTCEFGGGGITVGMNGTIPLDSWNPCWVSFISGIPCWIWTQPIY